MKLTDIQTGDTFIERVRFDLLNFETWLAPFIRFFINFQRWIKNRGRCKFNHSGDFEWINGQLWVWESRANGYHKRLASVKFDKLKSENVRVLRPMFPFDRAKWSAIGNEMEGAGYDWIGVLWFQLIFQISGKWLRKKIPVDKFFCNSSTGRRYYISTNGVVFKKWYLLDTEDLYSSKMFFRIPQD